MEVEYLLQDTASFPDEYGSHRTPYLLLLLTRGFCVTKARFLQDMMMDLLHRQSRPRILLGFCFFRRSNNTQ